MGNLDVLLIQTPNVTGTFFNLPGREIPISLCSLGAYLKREGLRCAILDLDHRGNRPNLLEDALREGEPPLVGISAYTPNVAIAANLAGRVKHLSPKTRTVLGGFHASALPERTLKEFPEFDDVVVGEGEATLTELARRVLGGADADGIAGLVSRRGGEIVSGPPRGLFENLDDLPFPDRTMVPVKDYIPDPGNYFQLPSTGIIYARGCPFQCTFCSKSVFGQKIRYRGEGDFLAELRECAERFGIRDFRLVDEAPTVNMKKIKSLAETILAEGLSITWNCFSRVDSVDEETLLLMRAAGCYHVTYGVESSLPGTLEKIRKKIDLARAEETMELTKKLGIECKANFILGFPWENAEDMRSVVRYAKRVSPDLVTFNLFKPLPGSRLYEELEESGKLRHKSWEDYFTTSEGLLFDALYTEAEAMKILRWAVFSFYFRPRFALQRLRRIARYPVREIAMLTRGAVILAREIAQAAMKALRTARPAAAR